MEKNSEGYNQNNPVVKTLLATKSPSQSPKENCLEKEKKIFTHEETIRLGKCICRKTVLDKSRLKGLNSLTMQLQREKTKVKDLTARVERLEETLVRAENRLRRGDVISPGVSKKVLEAMTRENTRLKETLKHFKTKGPSDIPVLVENKELYDIIARLREEKDEITVELEEVKRLTELTGGEVGIKEMKKRILSLLATIQDLNKKSKIHCTYSDILSTENELLKSQLKSLKDDKEVKEIIIECYKKE